MSASFGSGGNPGGGQSQDFDLNIAPIIDCFTVLITFLLVSAAFLSVGFFDAGLSAAGATAKSDKPPSVTYTLEVQPGKTLKLGVTGRETRNSTFKSVTKDGAAEYDFDQLTDQLKKFKAKYPDVVSLTLSADNKVTYAEVISVMERARKVLPSVLLGGF